MVGERQTLGLRFAMSPPSQESDERVRSIEMPFQMLDPDLAPPAYARPGDAGLDLRARSAVTLAPGARAAVPSGLAVAIPSGHAGLVMARSGLALRHGVTVVNSPGLVDSGYRGELIVALINLGDAEYLVSRGDRIAQLVIVPVLSAALVRADNLPPSPGGEVARGTGGFGHTGS